MQAQDAEATMYFSNLILSNPAYTGASGESSIVLSYRDYFPGYGFKVGSLYGSWDSYFDQLHGGTGIYIFENRLGSILNDLRVGGTYSYHLRAGRELFVYAGFMAAMIHRSLNTDNLVLPDQIDPLLGPVLQSGEIIDNLSRTMFDTGIGFLFIYRRFNGGVSVNHIAKPDLTGRGGESSRLARRFSVHATSSFDLENGIKLDPLVSASLQAGVITASAGIVTGYSIINVNLLTHLDSRQGVSSIQAGVCIQKSSLAIGYNHYFNPFRSEMAIPFTLSSQVTLRISLFSVEKRAITRAINNPKL